MVWSWANKYPHCQFRFGGAERKGDRLCQKGRSTMRMPLFAKRNRPHSKGTHIAKAVWWWFVVSGRCGSHRWASVQQAKRRLHEQHCGYLEEHEGGVALDAVCRAERFTNGAVHTGHTEVIACHTVSKKICQQNVRRTALLVESQDFWKRALTFFSIFYFVYFFNLNFALDQNLSVPLRKNGHSCANA